MVLFYEQINSFVNGVLKAFVNGIFKKKKLILLLWKI